MRFFGLKNCDTCRKALRALTDAGFEPTVIDVRKDGVSPEDIAMLLGEFGDALINRRSTTWRGLSEDQRLLEPAVLLAQFPTLMKRPVVETDDGVLLLGWTAATQNAIIS